jgi:shikimate dehydrogenase
MSNYTKTALIGHPVSQSKSPLIHSHWMKSHNIAGQYDAINVDPKYLADGIQKIIDDGYRGFNVTVPHKQAIFEICDEVDEAASIIGAVNTVIIEDGKLYGTNTDAYGFMQNIIETTGLPNFEQGPCVVLGAGGAARAVVYALAEKGAKEIIVANRTFEKAQQICAINDKIMRPIEWDERKDILMNASLLVNTTSLGMIDKGSLEIDISLLPTNSIVSDIVYVPLMTDLLIHAKERGNPIVTGIGMLLHQARLAFEKWHGVLPVVDEELEKIVLR